MAKLCAEEGSSCSAAEALHALELASSPGALRDVSWSRGRMALGRDGVACGAHGVLYLGRRHAGVNRVPQRDARGGLDEGTAATLPPRGGFTPSDVWLPVPLGQSPLALCLSHSLAWVLVASGSAGAPGITAMALDVATGAVVSEVS